MTAEFPEVCALVEPSRCDDCGTDTTPCTHEPGCSHTARWEYYIVHDGIWERHGTGRGFLCVGCLEQRLGRRLTGRDFPDYPINEPDRWDTARLAARRKA